MYEAGNMYFLEARPNTVSKDRGGKGAVTLINAEKKGCGSRMIISKQLEKICNWKIRFRLHWMQMEAVFF